MCLPFNQQLFKNLLVGGKNSVLCLQTLISLVAPMDYAKEKGTN